MRGFIGARHTTLASEISLTGTGIHSGAPVSIILYPADDDTGIRFLLSNGAAEGIEIAADHGSVTGVTLCTVLGDGNGASVATVEHLLAALRGLGVDNALIEIDSPEVPIMDGSSAQFVEAIDEVGLVELDAPRRFLKVLKTAIPSRRPRAPACRTRATRLGHARCNSWRGPARRAAPTPRRGPRSPRRGGAGAPAVHIARRTG